MNCPHAPSLSRYMITWKVAMHVPCWWWRSAKRVLSSHCGLKMPAHWSWHATPAGGNRSNEVYQAGADIMMVSSTTGSSHSCCFTCSVPDPTFCAAPPSVQDTPMHRSARLTTSESVGATIASRPMWIREARKAVHQPRTAACRVDSCTLAVHIHCACGSGRQRVVHTQPT